MTNPSPSAPASLSEVLFQGLTRAAGIGILTLVATLVAVLVADSWPVLSRAGEYRLFTSAEWISNPPPLPGADEESVAAVAGAPIVAAAGVPDPPSPLPTFGSLALIWGTIATSAIAIFIALPLGVASAAYMSEIAPRWVRRTGAFLIELLAAIPSVVYGFWGLVFLTPIIQDVFYALGGPNRGGNGIVAAGIVLAIMILPYITAISYDVCQAVPRSQREGSLALGATRWQTIWRVVLPFARPGIVAATFLALGRALGETMAVTMLIGNQAVIDLSPFALGDSIASRIANQFNEADSPTTRSALIALGLVLLLVTAAFNILARLILARLTRSPRPKPAAVPPVAAPAETPEPVPASAPPSPEAIGDSGTDTSEVPAPPPPAVFAPSRAYAQVWDRFMTGVLALSLVLTVVPLFLILGYITVRGARAIEPTLFTERARPNMTNEQFKQYREWQDDEAEYPRDALGRPVRRGGLGHAMFGHAMMVLMATAMALPVGLLAAVYLVEARRSRLAAATRFAAEQLGGVPSIVIGIFAYTCLVNPFWYGGESWGFNGWAGAFALGVMMIPIIVRSAEESMKLVPDNIRQASYALGATRTQTTIRIILPASMSAIVTGVFLAVGRIAGETAPLLLTAGQSVYWPIGHYDWSPIPLPRLADQTPFLPGYIYKYSMTPYLDWRDQAWGGALVLLMVVMFLNIGIRLLAGKRIVAAARAD
jgi:phosphate transport system permease protein